MFILPIRVLRHGLCLIFIREITLQTRNEQKIPYNLLRGFPSTLVSEHLAHWTLELFLVLISINDAIIDTCVVSYVWQIKRANYLFGFIDTTRQHVIVGKTWFKY
jgi:hypothetical protein